MYQKTKGMIKMKSLQNQINQNTEDLKIFESHTAMIYNLIDRIEKELEK